MTAVGQPIQLKICHIFYSLTDNANSINILQISTIELDILRHSNDLGVLFASTIDIFTKSDPPIDTLSLKIVNGKPFLSIEIPTISDPDSSLNNMAAILGVFVAEGKYSNHLTVFIAATESRTNKYIREEFDNVVASIKPV